MTTTLRAALSILLLMGFYVVALGAVVGLGVTTVWAFSEHAGAGAAKLGFLTVAVAVGLVVALWRVARAEKHPPSGVLLDEAAAPELWATVRSLAQVADTRAPDEIRLVAEVNAAVSEDTKLLGLVGGTRRLFLGVPLLQGLTAAQLRSVLAHELGHYSRSHTRLGPLAYRGRAAMVATVQQLQGNVVGWLLKHYTHLYLLVSAAVSRRQELEADELSVRVAGRATAQATLREIPALDSAWSFYTGQYMALGWDHGYAPAPTAVFEGFAQLLQGRSRDLAEMREHAPTEQSRWDSHPSIAARVAAMDTMPDADAPLDHRPATALVPAFWHHAARVAHEQVDYGTRQQVGWDELVARSMPVEDQRVADRLYRAVGRAAGTGSGSLDTWFDVVAGGGYDTVRRDTVPSLPLDEARAELVGATTAALRAAAVASGVAAWRLSWTGPATLVGPDGAPLDLEDVARLALDPATVAEARERVAGLGVDVASATQVAAQATAHGGQVVGGLANVKVDGTQHDVLVLDNGLVLAPCPKKTEGGKARLAALARSAPVAELARTHRFLPYEQIHAAVVRKVTPARVDLTLHGGATVTLHETWSGERLTKDSNEALAAFVTPYVRDTDPVAAS
ncbi:M48 family metallopeptidase [Cellulosimicrobium marinum]|uniref:M48 family metallopeptidase n=1 Tax=Cellulosimicrobium marinum TaxID=1638992 RepID=UPI001E314A26|nr:M48 family metallopeptidase [Cellulosimicrobium marinum]MCB7137139.1 M48 family metallopeptidase [Cellulosimicrobium marinum]